MADDEDTLPLQHLVVWECPDPGYHVYEYKDGRVICTNHGQYLGRVNKEGE